MAVKRNRCARARACCDSNSYSREIVSPIAIGPDVLERQVVQSVCDRGQTKESQK